MQPIKIAVVTASLLFSLQTVGAETKSTDAIGPMYVEGRSIIDPHPTAGERRIIAPMYLKGSRNATTPIDLKGHRSITTPSMINRPVRPKGAIGPVCMVRWSR